MNLLHIYVTVNGKTRPKSPEKRGNIFFFSKEDTPSDTFYPSQSAKIYKYIQKCLKIAPNVIKINSIPI
jgi:hypothetical protein